MDIWIYINLYAACGNKYVPELLLILRRVRCISVGCTVLRAPSRRRLAHLFQITN